MSTLTVDGYDLEDYGFRLTSWDRRLAPPETRWDETQKPSEPGIIVDLLRRGSRAIVAGGFVAADTQAEARANLDQVAWILSRSQPHTLRFGDDADKSIIAYARAFDPTPIAPEFAGGRCRYLVTLEFVAADPFFRDPDATVIENVSTTPVELPAGSADIVDCIIDIAGGENPTLKVFDHQDSEVASLGFTVDLTGDDDHLVIDLGRRTAYQNDSGTPNTGTRRIGRAEWTSGRWFRFRNSWWDFLNEDWMTATCSAGAAKFSYRIKSEV